MRKEFRLAGAGGQGLISASIILAEAIASRTDLYVAQTQSYGPESRGGSSRGDVIVSDSQVDYPEVTNPEYLLVMTQDACSTYAKDLAPGGVLIADSTYVKEIPSVNGTVKSYPISERAREMGREIVANMIGLGILAGLTGVVSLEVLEEAVMERLPKSTWDLNKKALRHGFEVGMQMAGGGEEVGEGTRA
ncbi:MAG: 2-oxoacid:acceptor oxidoreductase family protein [Firmicutes bacterium]|nr:2-oxoacid:acceptor oxidoreductase family protein [Candidatus Fermentithermobacillaceae bacterium]